jgi:NAD(P)-dependent dehydrogenase (short-subunit alcohol dehydrogenase family)
MDLTGKVAFVTGGSGDIGGAIARALAAAGADVAISYGGRPQIAQATVDAMQAMGRRGFSVPLDQRDAASIDAAVASIAGYFGRLDILVNNAGVGSSSSPLHELTPETWEKILNTNLRGVFYCIRAFAPMMIRAQSGYIINISSLAGKNALPNGAAYAASKWGLNGLSYSVAEELRSHNVRVSVVCPGSVDTRLGPHTGKDRGKMLKPEDVAHVVAMLVTQAPQSFASEVLLRPTQKP